MPFKFENLEIWQRAVEDVDLAYQIADNLPREEEFNLKSQLRRAATSIALNIAERSTGLSDAEQARFLGYALRSLLETVACQYLVRRRNYPVDSRLLQETHDLSQTLARKIQSMRKAITSKPNRVREGPAGYEVIDTDDE